MSRNPKIFNSFFFFNDTATTEIYTLSLHDALPILDRSEAQRLLDALRASEKNLQTWRFAKKKADVRKRSDLEKDRKSTRLNSSHLVISYAVFCLKKKK